MVEICSDLPLLSKCREWLVVRFASDWAMAYGISRPPPALRWQNLAAQADRTRPRPVARKAQKIGAGKDVRRGTQSVLVQRIALSTCCSCLLRRGMRRACSSQPGKAAAGESSGEEGDGAQGSASRTPNDRDVDPEFTRQFNAYISAYFLPHRRLWRWCRPRLAGRLLPQTSKQRPSALQRSMATLGWSFLMVLTAPVSSPLGALTAASWLVCGITDTHAVPSSFVRSHFRQALLLASLSALLAFQERTGFSPEAASGLEGPVPLVISAMRSGLLGALMLVWLVSVLFCLLGRYSVPTTDSSGSSQHVEG
eukprot:s400_g14.t1